MPFILTFVSDNFDILTFGLFFGCLLVLGLVEMRAARAAHATRRSFRWPANIALTGLNLAVLTILPVSGITAAHYAQQAEWGLFNWWPAPFAVVLVVGFLGRSLVSYVIHVLMHKVPVLWRIHRVHHTDTALDVTTTVRFHPLEFVVSVPLVVTVVACLGVPPVVIMLYELFDAAMAVFSHANLRLGQRADRVLRLVIVTPDMHRVHHSSYQPETDSNYGATLSLWDRLFGTHVRKMDPHLESMRLGLDEFREAEANSFWWLLRLPFRPATAPATPEIASQQNTGTGNKFV